jgi:hypothetical protein
MTPTTAREFAERLLDLEECPESNGVGWVNSATALIEADREAIREAAIRECVDKLELMSGNPYASSAEAAGIRMSAERLTKLLPPAEKAGPT